MCTNLMRAPVIGFASTNAQSLKYSMTRKWVIAGRVFVFNGICVPGGKPSYVYDMQRSSIGSQCSLGRVDLREQAQDRF